MTSCPLLTPGQTVRALRFLFALATLLPSLAFAGEVRGKVTSEDGEALPGATLTLIDKGTGRREAAASGPDGRYRFFNVPDDPYHLVASLAGFLDADSDVDVRGAVPVESNFKLKLQTAEREHVELEKCTVASSSLIWMRVRYGVAAYP